MWPSLSETHGAQSALAACKTLVVHWEQRQKELLTEKIHVQYTVLLCKREGRVQLQISFIFFVLNHTIACLHVECSIQVFSEHSRTVSVLCCPCPNFFKMWVSDSAHIYKKVHCLCSVFSCHILFCFMHIDEALILNTFFKPVKS